MDPSALKRAEAGAELPVCLDSDHYSVVVSRNTRNRALPGVLAVLLEAATQPSLPSIVELPPREVLTGRAACDDIYELWEDEVRQDLGAFRPATVAAIGDGLRSALSL